MLFLCLIAIILILLAYILYKKGNANSDYFADKGIKSQTPSFLLGNSGPLFLGKKSSPEFMRDLYNEFPDERVFGTFMLRRPAIIVRDPDLVKQLFIKEFDHFSDHLGFLDETKDTLIGKSLFNLTGEKWREMRATLSPAFTGSKMRLMFQSMVNVGDTMVKALAEEIAEKSVIEYEMKDFSQRFATDIIAICAYGINVDSFKDKKNDFFMTGKKIGLESLSARLRFMGVQACPSIMRFFNIELFDQSTKKFFKDMVVKTMEKREQEGICRPDMISLLMQAREGTLIHNQQEENLNATGFATVEESDVGKMISKREWTMDEFVAQCFIFFLGGFDTTSSVMSFVFYELAVNEDVQEKLLSEILDLENSLNDNQITYERLLKMKYLDMVVSETLRRWGPAAVSDRQCVKEFEFDDQNGFKFKFEEHFIIMASLSGFHFDPKYFPDPDKFDPERFSEENRSSINTSCYLPFGIGPRNCIASRFALMEIKIVVYKLLLNFKLDVLSRTDVPMVLNKSMGVPSAINGVWLGLSKRK